MKTTIKNNRWIILIVALYLAIGLCYSIAIPLGESPDESEHFLYLQYISLERSLPVMSPVYDENVTLEAHQPPLLYLVGAALTGWIEMDVADNLPSNSCFSFKHDDPGRQHVFLHNINEWPPQTGVYQAFQFMRWFSLVLGAGTIVLAYNIGRQIYPVDKSVGLIAAATLAFNPQFIFINASINNDVVAALLGAAIIFTCVTAVHKKRIGYFLILGLLVGLGMLAKFSILALWPLAVLAAILSCLYTQTRTFDSGLTDSSGRIISIEHAMLSIQTSNHGLKIDIKRLVINLLLVLVIPLLAAGWWYWRSYQLHGDPFMWQVSLQAKWDIIARTEPFTFSDLLAFIPFHFQSYWAWFGWLNVKPPDWLFILLAVVVGASLIGLIKLLFVRRPGIDLIAVAFNVLAILAIYASLLRYIQTINWTGYQGRLAFTAAASIAMLLALGWFSLGGARLASKVPIGFLVLAIVIIPTVILPAYPRPEIYQPTSEVTPICARFANGLQVEAVDSAFQVKPGEVLHLTIFGYGLSSATKPNRLELQLVGRNGRVVGRGFTDLNWGAGDVVSATMMLPIDEETLPTKAELEVGMRDTDGSWQPATSATGRILDVPFSIESVKIAPQQPVNLDPQFPLSYEFGDNMALLGYDISQESDQAIVTLYWRALTKISQDYTTFLHLFNEEGRIVAQDDGQPHDGDYPTSIWDTGEVVIDKKAIKLDRVEEFPGYELAVGVYLLETLQRQPVFDADHNRLPNDQALLRSE